MKSRNNPLMDGCKCHTAFNKCARRKLKKYTDDGRKIQIIYRQNTVKSSILRPVNTHFIAVGSIANDWRYEGIYSFYDMENDIEDYLEFINPDKRGENYFSVFDNELLIGYFTITFVDGVADIGFGLKPVYTGKGYGWGFVNAIIKYVSEKYHFNNFTLSVAQFNKRAIKVYEELGFKKSSIFMQETNGGQHEFVRMELKCT